MGQTSLSEGQDATVHRVRWEIRAEAIILVLPSPDTRVFKYGLSSKYTSNSVHWAAQLCESLGKEFERVFLHWLNFK